MLKKLLVFLVFFIALGIPKAHSSGDGGPILMAYNIDMSPINSFLNDNYGMPPIEPPIFMWGGAGTSWLNQNFGLGVVIAGGHRSSYKDNQLARYFELVAILQLKNVLTSTGRTTTYVIFGPGLMNIYLGLGGANSGEFLSYNMLIYIGGGAEYQISDTTSLELRLGYNIVPQRDWEVVSGNLSKPQPFSAKGMSAMLALHFGG